MPARNTVKTYIENTYYHIYNRGVEGREIFKDEQDYKVFLGFIKRYLTATTQNKVRPRWKNDLASRLYLSAYCLMPNHFHFLVKQITKDSMTVFMRALMNSYVGYFNKKYKRIGGLFQGKFKAVYINREEYLLHLTRYIHLNPLEVKEVMMENLENYYCSYGEYLGKRQTAWINHKEILNFFGSEFLHKNKFDSYKEFVEKNDQDSAELLGGLILD